LKICSECHGEFQDTVSKCPTDESDLDSEHVNPLIGTCLAGRYQIISMIGTGGAGVVYKAQHLKMDKPVAVKMMHSHMMAQPDAIRSFCDEAKTVAQLKHHNIVTVYDFGISTTNQPFLVMDYINGPSLSKYTEDNGPLSLEQMRFILAQIVDGLSYAHAEGIVHQDLKPQNIILSYVGQIVDKVTVVDFGLATLSLTEKEMAMSGNGNKKKKFIGSPYYMSPEQCLSNVVIDSRSDIYSLAIVLYQALSDKLPFEKKSAIAMMDSHVREIPVAFRNSNPELPGLQACTELTKVFNQAMAKEPDNRYKNISEFGLALDDALARDSVKVKAIKHRNLAAEQVLVHVNQAMQSDQSLDKVPVQASKLQLDHGTQFLSRQAEIEEAYLNSQTTDSKVSKTIKKENIIVSFLQRIGSICDSKKDKTVAPNAGQQGSECSNCKTPLKPGIQFCLNCQRTIAQPIRTTKLSEAPNGNFFANRSGDAPTLDEQQKAKTKLQKLRQNKLIVLARAHQFLNYALIAAIIIGGIIMIQRNLVPTSPSHNISDSLSKNRTANNMATTNPSH